MNENFPSASVTVSSSTGLTVTLAKLLRNDTSGYKIQFKKKNCIEIQALRQPEKQCSHKNLIQG